MVAFGEEKAATPPPTETYGKILMAGYTDKLKRNRQTLDSQEKNNTSGGVEPGGKP